MWTYIVRRCCIGVVLLLALTLVTFVLFFASPIDTARQACGKTCTEQQRDVTAKALGYDQPVLEQWSGFVKGLVVGRDYPTSAELREAAPEQVQHCDAPCLGYSKANEKFVGTMVKEGLPITVSLALMALFLWLVTGVLLGVLSAVVKGSLLDRGIVALTLVVYAFPTFFIGVFLLRYVSVRWQLVDYPAYLSIAEGGVSGWLTSLFLPALTLALVYIAGYVRMTRAFVLESMNEDYIRTAKAKGLKKPVILFKHGLRAALTPLLTMVGLDFAALLGGAIITESVFTYRGLGLLTVQANTANDLPFIIAMVVVAGTFVIVANIIVDVLYAFVDPRVRLG